MPPNKLSATVIESSESLEAFAPALANILTSEADKEIVLGQAWLASENTLITCGHVIEAYLQSPEKIVVKFPASGNCYKVREIKLHPGFLKQKDQLIKFDAALLKIELHSPESEAQPLPISFEQPLRVNQPVFAVRYPAHLGMITAAPNPLAQHGQILGTLRKHDNFHLLHDLALAQGDSGSPIFDGKSVVAMHCGDTASLPGLNLPTTSIRLALWVDALRELHIQATKKEDRSGVSASWINRPSVLESLSAFMLTCSLTIILILGAVFLLNIQNKQWKIDKSPLSPVRIKVNKIRSEESGQAEKLIFDFLSSSDCKVYLFHLNGNRVSFDTSHVLNVRANKECSVIIPTDNFSRQTVVESPAGTSVGEALASRTARSTYPSPNSATIYTVFSSLDLDLTQEELLKGKDCSAEQFFNWLRTFETVHKGKVLYTALSDKTF